MEGKAIFYIAAIVGGIGALLLVILLPMSFAGIEYYEVSSSISAVYYRNYVHLAVCPALLLL